MPYPESAPPPLTFASRRLQKCATPRPGVPALAQHMDAYGLWADHNVCGKTRGRKRFAHPLVGELTLDYVAMRAPDDPGMTMMIYSTLTGSEADASLRLLVSLCERPGPVQHSDMVSPHSAAHTQASLKLNHR